MWELTKKKLTVNIIKKKLEKVLIRIMANNIIPTKTTTNNITLSIFRPKHGIEIFSMSELQWSRNNIRIYPDAAKDQSNSDFPYNGITILRKHPGHFVVAQNDKQRWIFQGFTTHMIELGVFSPEWTGCCAVLFKEKDDAC